MHILLIPSWYKTKREPFMGTFFEEQARALMKRGHRTGVLYPAYLPPGGILDAYKEEDSYVVNNGLPTYCVFVQTKIPRSRRLNYRSYAARVDKALNRYIAEYGRPDILHAHSVFYGGIAARELARRHGIPLVITEHLTSYIMGTINNEYDRRLAVEIFTGADAALIVSDNFRRDLEIELSLPHDVFRVVHNMVADSFFEDFTPKTFSPGQEPFVLFTNSFLLPRKNHKLILDAFSILRERKADVDLRVGGDGPLLDELKAYAASNGLAGRVEFLGGLSRARVREQVRSSHAFVLASFYETFGVVLIESMAAGRPVIATDSGGPRDFVDDTNGILLREFSPGKMADAIERVMQTYGTYDQHAISAACHARFNEQHIAGQLEGVYRDVLQRTAP